MQAPFGSAGRPKTDTQPRQMTDAEFFGAPERTVCVVTPEKVDRPDWYTDWLGGDKLKQDFIVWYDAWEAVEIFGLFQFQWLHGFNGVTGLNYLPIMAFIELRHTRKSRRMELLVQINALELGAMTAFAEVRRISDDKAEKGRDKQ